MVQPSTAVATPANANKASRTRRSMRNYQIFGFVGLIVVAGGIGAWAALSSIQGAVIASGKTVVETSLKKIQHREGGIVKKIFVKEGERVKAGQLLLSLDKTDAQARFSIVQASIDEAEAEKARLEALRDGAETITFSDSLKNRASVKTVANLMAAQEKLFRAQRATTKGRLGQLKQRIEQLQKEITGLKSQALSRREQVELISKELADLEKLHKKGLVPVTRLLALKREKAKLTGQQGQIDSSIARANSQIGETRLQIITVTDEERRKTLAQLRDTIAKLKESRERAIAIHAALKRTDIKAPRSGYVHQLAVHTIGGVIAPGEVVMKIVPDLDELLIEARVKPRDIDQVHLGQGARVRFPSFDMRTTPEITAKVAQVSADLTQLNAQTPAFFAIKIRLSKQELSKLGANKKIVPGMPAEVFIQTRARSPLSYLIQPLRDQIMRTFRES